MRHLVRAHFEQLPGAAVVPPPPVHPSGRRIINFTLGDPSKVDPTHFSTPRHIQEAATGIGYAGEYLPPRGHTELLALLSHELGIPVEQIVIVNGASEGMEKLVHALDGSLLMPSPCFPPYIENHRYHERALRFYRVDRLRGPDLEDIERGIDERTAAILVINPSNPTGMACQREALEGIIAIARKHGLAIVADEVYNELTFHESPPRLRTLTKEVPIIEVGSFSKTYLMCGYRIGWLAFYNVNDELAALKRALEKLCFTRLSANAAQRAAIAALKGGTAHLAPMMAELGRRKEVMIEGLRSIPGIEILQPDAGFYLWFGLRDPRFANDQELVAALAAQQATYILPGSAFGYREEGMHWFRAVFLPPTEEIQEGMERVHEFLMVT